MNIIMITSGYLPIPPVKGGAVEQLIDDFLRENEKCKKHNITVYSIEDNLAREMNSYKACKVEYIDTGKVSFKISKVLRRLINLLPNIYIGNAYINRVKKNLNKMKLENIDAIIIENSPEFALALPKKLQSKTILHLHNDFLNNETKLNQKIFNSYRSIFSISNFIKNKVESIESSYKVKTLYNGVDLKKFNGNLFDRDEIRKKYNISKSDKIIMFVGRIVEEKGVKELIKAVINIPKEYNIKLIIVGGINYSDNTENRYIKNLKKMSEKYKDKIIFTGFIDYKEIPKLYSIADIGVIPSLCNDAFNLTTIEYMQSGVPVIVSDRGAMKELINDDCGIIVNCDIDFIESLEKAIIKLLDDELRICMSKWAKVQAKKFSKEIYCNRFNYLLDEFEMENYKYEK